jgi:site-specific DNA-methyltransferase (adenine-specific)
MEIVYKKISEIKPYENNPRDNSKAIEQVKQSIEEFGFKVPIVIDKDGVIVAGHTRYEASKLLKLKEIPCIIADDLDENQIKAFRIADNKVTDYSIWDNKKLLEELESLEGLDIFTGFKESELFGEELDEKDDDFISEIIEQTGKSNLVIKYQCKSLEEFDDIMNYIESIKSKYE